MKRHGLASSTLPLSLSTGLVIAYSVWGAGTFLVSLLVLICFLIEFLIQAKLPGSMLYVALVLGPIIGCCGAIATKHSSGGKICLIIATLCLLPIQCIIIGMVLLATNGLEGIQ
jgi:uncharacterized membrane protein AbrB (regulator of aidB expression)